MDERSIRFVEFQKYCETCKHWETATIDEEPCCCCVSEPVHFESEKPVKYEPKEHK